MKSILLIVCLWLLDRNAVGHTMADEVALRQIRHPVALVTVNEGRQLAVANRRSGTLSLIDLAAGNIVHETRVGQQLSDICATSDPARFLVTDEAAGQLLVVKLSAVGWTVEHRQTVAASPVNVKIFADGGSASVASLWSRTLSIVDLSSLKNGQIRLKHQFRLPFAPREQLVIEATEQQRLIPSREHPETRLLVADAFGSKLAVVDPQVEQLESVREFPAHAIRCMRLHPTKPRLLLTHQMLSRLAHTTFDDVHWGGLMVNCFRSLELADILDPQADLLKRSQLEYLGGPERGAGDPAGFVMRSDGILAIALGGTDEVIVDDGNHWFTRRLPTGNGPSAVALSPDGSQAFIVNSLSDSITVVDLAEARIVSTISLGERPEETTADRGEKLFHDARLSHDRWFSCASCHVDGHTNGLLNDNMTDGSFGTAKRVLSLRGIADTAPYAWSGRFKTLAEQISHSVRSTMQGEPITESQTSDLESYLQTLAASPAVGSRDKEVFQRGSALFEKLDCRSCHTPPTYTSAAIVDVKLQDERGTKTFNPPSLRGVSQNAPYFHDGRAATLDAVFSQFRHQLKVELSSEELADLVAFLSSI